MTDGILTTNIAICIQMGIHSLFAKLHFEESCLSFHCNLIVDFVPKWVHENGAFLIKITITYRKIEV